MSANLGSASGSIHLEVAQARQNVRALAGDLRSFTAEVGSGFGGASAFIDQHEQSIRTVGQGLLGLGTIATGLFSAGVWGAANVEEAFAIMQAGTGATGAELDALQQKALQLGKDTVFSATEAAAAITELGKAGLPVETILGGAADAVVNLAVAGEMNLAQAANVLTAAMNQYGLSADQAVMVTDTLARGAAMSTADISDLASGLSYVGTTANQLGISLPHTTAALAALNDQGIRGSKAGTSLNQMLTSIINPSQKAARMMDELGLATGGAFELIDSQTGQMKSLPEIIRNVHDATKDLTEAERARYINAIFGEQGGRAINALLQTQTDEAREAGKAWEDYEAGVAAGTTAAENAAAKMDNLKGDLEQLKGGLETLSYTAMQTFLPAFRTVVQALDGVLSAIVGLPPGLQTIIAGMIGLVGVLSLGAGGFLLMLPRINDTIKAYRALRTALAATQLAQRGLALSLRGLITAHPVLLGLMAVVAVGLLAYKTNVLGFRDAVQRVIETVRDFITSFRQMYDLVAATGKYDGPVAFFRALGFALADLLGLDLKRWVGIFTELGVAINRPIQAVKKFTAGFRELVGALRDGNWSKALARFRKMLAGLGDFLASPAKAVGTLLKSIKTGFKPLDTVLTNLGKVWTDFGRLIQEVFQGDINGALEVGKRLLRHFADYLRSLGPLIWESAKAIGRKLVEAFRAIDWGAVGTVLLDGLKGAVAGLADIAGEIGAAASSLWDWLTESIGDINWGNVRDTLRHALETAIAGLSAALEWVLQTGVPAITGWIVDIAGDVWGGMKRAAGWAAGAVSGVIDLALSVVDTLAETVLSGFASAKGWLIDKIPWLAGPLDSTGQLLSGAYNLVMNVAGTLMSTLGAAWQSARTLVATIAGWLVNFFGIGDDGSASPQTAEATGSQSLIFRLLGTFVSRLGAAWSSARSLIASLYGWLADFFGISDDGAATGSTTSASGTMSLAMNLLGSFISYLDGAWSSVRSLIAQAGSWLADFFGISDAGEVGEAITKTAQANVSFAVMIFGAVSDFLGDGWSSVGDLVNKARHWIADFFGITSASDLGQTASKTAKAALTLAAEFTDSITDNLGSEWESVKGLVGSVASVAKDLVTDTWGGATKVVESAVDIVVTVSGNVKDALGAGWNFLFGGDAGGSAPAITLEARIGEVVTAIETGLQQIADAFSGFDASGHVTKLNDDLAAAFGAMSGDAIGSAAKAWVERGLAKIGEGITSESLMMIPRSLDTSLSGAFGMMSGDSVGGAIKGWLARAVALVAIGNEGHGLALARSLDTAAGTGFGTLSGESLSGGIKGWLARGIALVAAGLTTLGTALAIALDTAAGAGFGTLSGESLSGALVAWIDRAQALASAAVDMTTLASGVANKLQSAIAPKLNEIVSGFRTFATNVVTETRRLQTNASREMGTTATNLRRSASDARTAVQSAFRDIESAARTMASTLSREASRAGSDLASQLRNGANQARTAMATAMNEIVGIVQGAAGRMRSAGYAVGAAAGDGVAAGLNASLGAVRSAANALIDEVDRAMRAKAKIASPSKLTTWIGQMLGQGPVVGMLSQLRDLRRAAEAVMEAATPVLDRTALDSGIGRYLSDQLARQRWRQAGLGAVQAAAGLSIGTQNIEINVTQAEGENGEQFASRVVSLLVDAYNGVNGLGV
jgi:TP901 family phage tail tape measure protein